MADFVRYVISGVTDCPLDRQGRILLSPTLRGEFGIERDIVLNGMLENFEIWDRSAWQIETQQTRARFSEFKPDMSVLGIF